MCIMPRVHAAAFTLVSVHSLWRRVHGFTVQAVTLTVSLIVSGYRYW